MYFTTSQIRFKNWYSTIRTATVPLWLPVVVLLGYPFLAVMTRLRRRARSRTGVCSTCLYNLAGNVSGLCPECGTAISEKQRALLSPSDRRR